MTILERGAIVSGIGMSTVGRRTGQSAIAMTADSYRAAIADAGLTAAEINGMASLGEILTAAPWVEFDVLEFDHFARDVFEALGASTEYVRRRSR